MFALSMPTSVVITGMDSMKVLEQNLEIMKNFKPMGKADLKRAAGPHAPDGRERQLREIQDQQRLRRHGASSRVVGMIAGIGQAGFRLCRFNGVFRGCWRVATPAFIGSNETNTGHHLLVDSAIRISGEYSPRAGRLCSKRTHA